MIKKIAVCFACTLLAILLAAIYGALHNQITYSIAPEYFTVFKFDQFGFSDWGMQSPRLTTAWIGILATWWMGLFLGAFLSILGLIHSDYKTMFRFVMRSIYITFLVTILSGVLGYVVGWFDTETYKSCCFPYNIQDPFSGQYTQLWLCRCANRCSVGNSLSNNYEEKERIVLANPQKIKFKSVADFLKSLPASEWEIVELLRELILETVPDVQERLAYNVPFYYRNRRIAFIWPASVPWGNIKEGVALGFVGGNALLKTDVNADSKVARIVFKSVSEIDPEWVRQLLYVAILVDDQFKTDQK